MEGKHETNLDVQKAIARETLPKLEDHLKRTEAILEVLDPKKAE